MSADGNELIAIAFDDEFNADEARIVFRRAQREGLIELAETAVVEKSPDGKLRVSQDVDVVAKRRTAGHWLGIMAALATGVQPLILVGTAAGEVVGKLNDTGIGDKLMKEIGHELKPGGSALFVLGKRSPEHRETIVERLRPLGGTMAYSSLSPSDEQEPSDAYRQAQAGPA